MKHSFSDILESGLSTLAICDYFKVKPSTPPPQPEVLHVWQWKEIETKLLILPKLSINNKWAIYPGKQICLCLVVWERFGGREHPEPEWADPTDAGSEGCGSVWGV